MHGQDAIRKRLFIAIDQCGDSLKDICIKTDTNYSYLSALRKKKNFDIPAKLVANFCAVYHVNPAWILLGQGTPKGDIPPDIISRLDQLDANMKALFNRDTMLETLLGGLLKPSFINKPSDLTKLLNEAKKRKN